MGEEHTAGWGYMDLGVQMVEVDSSLVVDCLVELYYWIVFETKALIAAVVSFHSPWLSAVVEYP